jgi:hypothetical protein
MAATRKPVALDAITDPEAGLALLAQRPDDETPEQKRLRLFWQFRSQRQSGLSAAQISAQRRGERLKALFDRHVHGRNRLDDSAPSR